MKLVFLDTETTGLDHTKHEIIEIAVVVMENGVRTKQIECKIKPQRIETAEPKALEINGYSEELWKDAGSWTKETSLEIREIIQNSMIVGHNPMFDMRFIEAACTRFGVRLPLRPVFDTKCAAYMLGHKRLGMDRIREQDENMTKEGAHRALKDVEDCIYLFERVFNKN
jgi:DNA polymerase III alpha subunit (gram-positive type)